MVKEIIALEARYAEGASTKSSAARSWRAGKVRMGVLLWALGVPIPFLLVYFLIRGCV